MLAGWSFLGWNGSGNMSDDNARTKTRQHLRVQVNPIKCTAFGFCAEFLPEVFQLDDWGYAWLQRPDVPMSLAAAAYETARLCPTGAISVEVVDEPDLRAASIERQSASAVKQSR